MCAKKSNNTADRTPQAEASTTSQEQFLQQDVRLNLNFDRPVFMSSARDLTARKRAEEDLRKSDEMFRSTLNDLLVGVVVHAADTGILISNPQANLIFGLSEEQMVGKKAIDPAWHFVNEDLSVMKIEDYPVSRVISSREKISNQIFGISRPDGDGITWVTVSAVPVFTEENELSRVVVNFLDITERKQADRDLRENEEKYRILFETETDAIMICDGETRHIIDVNNAAEALYGYSRAEFLQLLQTDITDEPEATDTSIPESLARQIPSDPFCRHRKKDGTIFPVEIAACSFFWNGRSVICSVLRDITERVKGEEELDLNRKELRKLASELSLAELRERHRLSAELHDGVSQLLSSAFIRLEAFRKTPLSEPAIEAVDTITGIIRESLQQVRSLTFELSCPMLNELGLAASLEEMCSSLSGEYSIHFEFNGELQPLPLHLDRQLALYRSTRELLINVMKHSGATCARVNLERADTSLRICVEDDGVGFDATMVGLGFSKSGGFGLFNIGEYLRHAGGHLEIESIPGAGTNVVLKVPLEEEHG